MSKLILILICTVFLTTFVSSLVLAREGDVMMVGSLLLRVRCPAAGFSVQERTSAIQERVNDLLILGGIDLDKVRVVRLGKSAAVYIGEKLLVVADPCTAKANGTTPLILANTWAKRFKEIYPDVFPKLPNAGTCPSNSE